ncbi:YdcH family protein [Rhizobium alvei]|uniref:YdcH family protein n=1 Tax=Rhizobium alvei TaxID=1132659 RepID=A0ABT8YPV4_9HYPH|nr:YdcH family protein [Rhizobium alvei]MDO6965703.1 YdcH family protein [Rhizobium alvei]
MSNTPHELAAEFPEFVKQMQHLKSTDGHFARLYNEYHDINGRIHRAETDIEPLDDVTVIDLRKQRMQLKDELYGMLVHHEPEAEKLGD